MQDHEDTALPVNDDDLAALRKELSPTMLPYREQVLAKIEPSAEFRSNMHRMMLGLVRDDVINKYRETSWSTLVKARMDRWMSCWRQLVEESLVFRVASQGALALGLGLLLSMAWITAMDEGVRAAPALENQKQMLPADVRPLRFVDSEELPPQFSGSFRKEFPDHSVPLKKR